MNIKEIRTGNLLEANIKNDFQSDLLWKTIEVVGLEDNTVFRPEEPNKVFFLYPDIATFNIYRKFTKLDDEFLRGIPLTEEWLIKFDCKKDKIKHSGKSITPIAYIIDKEYYFQWYSHKSLHDINTGELMIISNKKGFIKIVKYVHQLQNLYFSLTEKELTLKQ